MASSNLNIESKPAEKNLPNYLKLCIVIVGASFLGFSIYWAVKAPFTFYELISILSSPFFREFTLGHPFALPLIASQEFAATIGLFINLIAALLVFQCTLIFLKNDKKWLKTLIAALLFEAAWFILLIPTSIHHLVGFVFSMNTSPKSHFNTEMDKHSCIVICFWILV